MSNIEKPLLDLRDGFLQRAAACKSSVLQEGYAEMQPAMNWDDLRVFLALARAGTLLRAAQSTGQNATTVGRRLARLETALGVTLFEHGATGQHLTGHGQRLLEHAERMETSARTVEQQSDRGPGLSGTIRLSVSEGFGTGFLAPRLPRFVAQHPGIALDLVASNGFLNPSRREADIAIMLARPRGGPLIAAKLTDYHLRVYASEAHLAATGPIDSIEALTARRLVGYVPDLIYAPELRYLAEVDERLEPDIRSSSILAQASLIGGGAGVGILPCFLAATLPGLVRILPRSVAIRRTFWLVAHRDSRRLARHAAFIDWLRAEVEHEQDLLLDRGA